MKKLAALALSLCAAMAAGQESYSAQKSDFAVEKNGGLVVPSGYLTIKDETTALAQQSILTFIGTGVACVNNAGNFASECTITAGSGYSVVMEEGGALTSRGTINFIGSGITCADNGGSSRTDCTLANVYSTVQDEGSGVTARSIIDFAGSGVSCVDSGGTKTLCTITSGGTTPTGTGFTHITAGAQDAAAKLVDTADVNADQITYAKIQNVSATDRILGRDTAGAGDIEEMTTSAVLDMRTTTQGSLLYRGASTWDGLAPGVAGTEPIFTGAAANPVADIPLPGKYVYLIHDEFDGTRTSVTSTCGSTAGWTVTNSGTGSPGNSTCSSSTYNENEYGALALTTSTDAAGTANISRQVAAGRILGGEQNEWLVYVPTASGSGETYVLRFGLCDQTGSADCVDGLYWEYTDTVNSGNWTIKSASNSTRTTANTSSALTTGAWVRYTIIVNAAANSVAFYINGTEVANSPITTNIPTGSGRFTGGMFVIAKTGGTTAREAAIGFYDLRRAGMAR